MKRFQIITTVTFSFLIQITVWSESFSEQLQGEIYQEEKIGDLNQSIQTSEQISSENSMVEKKLWDIFPWSSVYPGGFSLDGKFVSFVDWKTGNLVVHDLTTGTDKELTKNVDWASTYGLNDSSVISPDNELIIYNWYNLTDWENRLFELRVSNMDGSNMRIVFHNKELRWVHPLDWSLDGKYILVLFAEKWPNDFTLQTRKLGIISIDEGSVRMLHTWNGLYSPNSARFFSPDGRYIVFDLDANRTLRNSDIFMLEVESGRLITIVEHPSNDQCIGWTPDGNGILFISDRSSKHDLWIIKMNNGVPTDKPFIIKKDFQGHPIKFTPDGSLYYTLDTTKKNVYIASLNETGDQLKENHKIASSRYINFSYNGSWSPDGKFLAYHVNSGLFIDYTNRKEVQLVILSLDTNEEKQIQLPSTFQFTWGAGPYWSNDGKNLFDILMVEHKKFALCQIDIATGKTIVIREVTEEHFLKDPIFTSNNEIVYYRSVHNGKSQVMSHNFKTGEEKELYEMATDTHWGLSPDGNYLAYFYKNNDTIGIFPTSGEQPRDVVHLDKKEMNEDFHIFVTWTPDGKYILYPKCTNQLWRANIETGEQHYLGDLMPGTPLNLDIHSNGRMITYSTEQDGSELWVMENFLPDEVSMK